MKMAIAAAVLLASFVAAHAADPPKVQPTPVANIDTTITGQRIVVPTKPDVIVATALFPPGARLPVHKHLYPHYVYVTLGTLTVVNIETHTTRRFQAGSFIAEPVNTWHYGVNNENGPLTVLVIDQVPHGMKGNMVTKP
ncbi:MAG: cupin domain-containing protein [Rhizomicrobium sp.]